MLCKPPDFTLAILFNSVYQIFFILSMALVKTHSLKRFLGSLLCLNISTLAMFFLQEISKIIKIK